MSATARAFGIARSLAMYYGIPFRARRLRRFYAQFVQPGTLCFDVGAHAGNRVRCWRQLGARVIAIEPQADFVRLLRWLYGRDDGVEIVPLAVGASPGYAELLVSERTPTVTTLSREWVQGVQRDPRFARRELATRRTRRGRDVAVVDRALRRARVRQSRRRRFRGRAALAGLTTPVRALSFEYVPATREIALDCIDRLTALGSYRYNWSLGESHRLASERWLDAAGIRAHLRELPPLALSGDVYAVREDG